MCNKASLPEPQRKSLIHCEVSQTIIFVHATTEENLAWAKQESDKFGKAFDESKMGFPLRLTLFVNPNFNAHEVAAYLSSYQPVPDAFAEAINSGDAAR
jgi:hypothetical protein